MDLPLCITDRKNIDGIEYIDLESFITFIKDEHEKDVQKDSMSKIESKNIHRTFNGYREHPIQIDEVKYVPMFSLIRYVFAHSEKLNSCKFLSDTILM